MGLHLLLYSVELPRFRSLQIDFRTSTVPFLGALIESIMAAILAVLAATITPHIRSNQIRVFDRLNWISFTHLENIRS